MVVLLAGAGRSLGRGAVGAAGAVAAPVVPKVIAGLARICHPVVAAVVVALGWGGSYFGFGFGVKRRFQQQRYE